MRAIIGKGRGLLTTLLAAINITGMRPKQKHKGDDRNKRITSKIISMKRWRGGSDPTSEPRITSLAASGPEHGASGTWVKESAFEIFLGRRASSETLASIAHRSGEDTIRHILTGKEFAERVVERAKNGLILPHEQRSITISQEMVSAIAQAVAIDEIGIGDVTQPRPALARIFSSGSFKKKVLSWRIDDASRARLTFMFDWGHRYTSDRAPLYGHSNRKAVESQRVHGAGRARRENTEEIVATTPEGVLLHIERRANTSEIAEYFAELYGRRQYDLISFLYKEQKSRDFSDNVRFFIVLYFSRVSLDLNAAETAYRLLSELLSSAVAKSDLIPPEEIVRARKLLARAALRSGRTADAAAIWGELAIERPTDWQSYFHLGSILGVTDPDARRYNYAIAYGLAKEVPEAVLCTLVESNIDDRNYKEARLAALIAMKRRPMPRQMWICLANLAQATRDYVTWQKYIDRYFLSQGLEPPRFSIECGNLHEDDVFSGICSDNLVAHQPEKKIRVIMTCFNSEATIEYAVKSVLDQTHENLELVVVDDCSTDNSREIVQALCARDQRIIYVQNEKNVGTYVSKNRAIICDSDFVTFHDSDDWMHPRRLERQLKPLLQNDNLVATNSNWIRMDLQGRSIVRRTGGFEHENPASTLVRRGVFDQIGLFDNVRTGADSEFLWRMRAWYGHQNVLSIRDTLALGLHREDSLTQAGSTAFDEHRFSRVRLDYWESWVGHHLSTLASESPDFSLVKNGGRAFPAPEEIRVDG